MGHRLLLAEIERELPRVAAERSGSGLTATERRVADLIAGGATNREAAAALFVNVRTVETHVAAVYRKLGVRNRAGLARRLSGLRSTTDTASPRPPRAEAVSVCVADLPSPGRSRQELAPTGFRRTLRNSMPPPGRAGHHRPHARDPAGTSPPGLEPGRRPAPRGGRVTATPQGITDVIRFTRSTACGSRPGTGRDAGPLGSLAERHFD